MTHDQIELALLAVLILATGAVFARSEGLEAAGIISLMLALLFPITSLLDVPWLFIN
jgi:hypothetical protein